MIKKKEYKYNKKKETLKKIFKNPTTGTFIILSQLTGLTGASFDKLKKYGKENNLNVEYLNYKKMKQIFVEGQDIVGRMNNEMLVIQGTNYSKEIKEILKFLKDEAIEEKVLILTILVENNNGYREMSLEQYKKKNIIVEEKEAAIANLYKMLKVKVMGIQLKLIKILNDNNKSNKE